ncbi:hypothetical protein GYB62_00090 [bacterium]|nr:hypothetical protein [bacterium]
MFTVSSLALSALNGYSLLECLLAKLISVLDKSFYVSVVKPLSNTY